MNALRKLVSRFNILKSKFPFFCTVGSFALLFAVLILIIFTIQTLSFPVVLQFNEIQGIVMFGNQTQVFGIWFAFFALMVLNAILAEFLFFRERFLSYTLTALNALVSLLLLVSVIEIIYIN